MPGLNPIVIRAPSDTVARGQVSDENPGGGSKVGKGSTITLTVSTGKPKAIVPERRRPRRDERGRIAGAAGAQSEDHAASTPAPRSDTVTAQQPHAGDRVDKGTIVRINVSRGAEAGDDSRRRRRSRSRMRSRALNGLGFVVARVDVQSDLPQGTVVAEDPPAGTAAPSGSTVTLSVSKGPASDPGPGRHRVEPGERRGDPDGGGPDARGDLRPGHRPEPGRHRPVDRPGGRDRRRRRARS